MSERKPEEQRISSVPPFGLRMLPDLRERIEDAARNSGRSMNAEIVARLEESFLRAAGDGDHKSDKSHASIAVGLAKTVSNIIDHLIEDKADAKYIATILNSLNSISEVRQKITEDDITDRQRKAGSRQ